MINRSHRSKFVGLLFVAIMMVAISSCGGGESTEPDPGESVEYTNKAVNWRRFDSPNSLILTSRSDNSGFVPTIPHDSRSVVRPNHSPLTARPATVKMPLLDIYFHLSGRIGRLRGG